MPEIIAQIADFLAVLFGIFYSKLLFNFYVNPVSAMFVWWGGWLTISNLNENFGLFIPSPYTQFLILTFLLSYLIGATFATYKKNKKTRFTFNLKLGRRLLDITFLTLFILIIPYFIKALAIFSSVENTYYFSGYYRAAIFSPDPDKNILFVNLYITYFYFNIVFPTLFTSTILSIVYFLLYQIKRYLIIALLLTILKAVMTLGRDDLYSLIILLSISVFFCSQTLSLNYHNKGLSQKVFQIISNLFSLKINKAAFVSFIIVIFIFLSVYLATSFRTTDLKKSPKQNTFISDTMSTVVSTHTLGFVLLDNELTKKDSFLSTHEITYGLSTLSGLEDLLSTVLIRRLIDYQPLSRLVGQYQSNFAYIGPRRRGNAYYTIIFNLYLDGRELFVCFVSMLLGFVTTRLYLSWLKNFNIQSLSFLLTIFILSLMSMTQNQFGSTFYIAVLEIFLYFKILNKNSNLQK